MRAPPAAIPATRAGHGWRGPRSLFRFAKSAISPRASLGGSTARGHPARSAPRWGARPCRAARGRAAFCCPLADEARMYRGGGSPHLPSSPPGKRRGVTTAAAGTWGRSHRPAPLIRLPSYGLAHRMHAAHKGRRALTPATFHLDKTARTCYHAPEGSRRQRPQRCLAHDATKARSSHDDRALLYPEPHARDRSPHQMRLTHQNLVILLRSPDPKQSPHCTGTRPQQKIGCCCVSRPWGRRGSTQKESAMPSLRRCWKHPSIDTGALSTHEHANRNAIKRDSGFFCAWPAAAGRPWRRSS